MRIRLTVHNDHDPSARKCLCIPCIEARTSAKVRSVTVVNGRDAHGKYAWETMAKMGWDNAQAAEHRGVTYNSADYKMQQARKKLRAQGWTFQAPVKPPTPDGRVWTSGSDAEHVTPPPIVETRAERIANDALRSGFAARFKASGTVRK